MKSKLVIFFSAILAISAFPVFAQNNTDEEDHRFQVAAGYSFQRKPSDDTLSRRAFGVGQSNRNLNGLNLEGTYYFTHSLGITGNFSAHFDKDKLLQLPANATGLATSQNVQFKERTFNYMAGPQVRFLNKSRVTPFARVLFGAQTTQSRAQGLSATNATGKFDRTNFAMAVGGGVDVRVNERLAIRAIQVDYVPSFERQSRANIFGTTRRYQAERVDQIRIGFGIVFK